jgi:hypothetical protein
MLDTVVISNASKCVILAHVLVSVFIVRINYNGEGKAFVVSRLKIDL